MRGGGPVRSPPGARLGVHTQYREVVVRRDFRLSVGYIAGTVETSSASVLRQTLLDDGANTVGLMSGLSGRELSRS